jgi:anti-anti-sigma factor
MGVRADQQGLTIAVAAQAGVISVFLDGELDGASASLLVRTLEGLAAQRFVRLWVYLAGVTYIDDEAIEVLLTARARVREQRREFVVRSPSSEVARRFEQRADCAVLLS